MNSELEDVEFENIIIQHNTAKPCGGFLKCGDCVIKNVNVDNVIIKGIISNNTSIYRRVIDIRGGGRVVNCNFENCTLVDFSFLLTFSPAIAKSQVSVKNLKGGTQENMSMLGGSLDISFQRMFEEK